MTLSTVLQLLYARDEIGDLGDARERWVDDVREAFGEVDYLWRRDARLFEQVRLGEQAVCGLSLIHIFFGKRIVRLCTISIRMRPPIAWVGGRCGLVGGWRYGAIGLSVRLRQTGRRGDVILSLGTVKEDFARDEVVHHDKGCCGDLCEVRLERQALVESDHDAVVEQQTHDCLLYTSRCV